MVWAVKQAENITSQAFISKSDKGSFTIITNDDLALTAAVQGKLRYHGKSSVLAMKLSMLRQI